jgi:hypothetical protein
MVINFIKIVKEYFKCNTDPPEAQYLYWMSYTDDGISKNNWTSQVDHISQSIQKPIVVVQDSIDNLHNDM